MATKNRGRIRTPYKCSLSPEFLQLFPYSLFRFSSLDLTPYNCPPIVCPPSPLLTWFPTTFPLFFVPLLLSLLDSLHKYPLFFVPFLFSWPDSLQMSPYSLSPFSSLDLIPYTNIPLFFVPLLPSPKDYSHLFNVPRNEAARTCSGWGMFRLPSF